MNIETQLAVAANAISNLVNRESPVTASLDVIIGKDGVSSSKYRITTGDICDRGTWKWVCAFGDTPEQCVDSASVQCAAQADKRALEIRDLTKRAQELGLVVTAAEGTK